MTIEEALTNSKKQLSNIEAKILISKVTNHKENNLINYLKEELTKEQELELNRLIKERIDNNKPIQYLTNEVNFCGLDLYVNENVLIPRFETEELVENTIKNLKEKFNNPKVLDLCCGSGAIGLAIKDKLKESLVSLSDISKEALEVTKINKDKLKLDVEIIESDLFNNINNKFDCIVSNPPYIREDEEIEDIVKDNEPHLALYAGPDGLDFYRRILKDAKKYLNDNFLLAFEIGYEQKEAIEKIAKEYFDNIEIECKKDLSNKDRMIFIYNK